MIFSEIKQAAVLFEPLLKKTWPRGHETFVRAQLN